MKKIVVNTNKQIRLDKFLYEEYPLLTISNINKFIRQNKIKVNSKKIKSSDKLNLGDEINLYISNDYFLKPNKDNAYMFARDDFKIIYEDENLAIVNKDAGIQVIDENFNNYDTLINRAIKYYKQANITPILCHRLDTGTSGIVVIAKTNDFLNFMLEEFKNKSLEKTYVCITFGKFNIKNPIQKAFLFKDSKTATALISSTNKNKSYKEIETHINLEKSINNFNLLNIKLITGRTHQIRAHLKFLNLPIIGDSKYGILGLNRKYKLKYQLLHSSKLKFNTIKNEKYKYLENKEFICDDPWFINSFYNNEFK